MPGDPARTVRPLSGQLKPEALDALKVACSPTNHSSNNMSIIGNSSSGQFGVSIAFHPTPVIDVMSTGLFGPRTLWHRRSHQLCYRTCSARAPGVPMVSPMPSHRQPRQFYLLFLIFWMAMLRLRIGFTTRIIPLGMAHGPYSTPGFTLSFSTTSSATDFYRA